MFHQDLPIQNEYFLKRLEWSNWDNLPLGVDPNINHFTFELLSRLNEVYQMGLNLTDSRIEERKRTRTQSNRTRQHGPESERVSRCSVIERSDISTNEWKEDPLEPEAEQGDEVKVSDG